MKIKSGIKSILRQMGYDIRRIPDPVNERIPLGKDPFADIKRLVTKDRPPILFDVGANVGQTIENFRRYLGEPIIHAFEPGPDTFKDLQQRNQGIPRLHLNNVALGAQSAPSMEFFESSVGPELSSLLEPSVEIWGGGGVKGKCSVPVMTVDEYCAAHGVGCIDVLKTDTQGFDFEVIKGARSMLQNRAVHMVYMEVLFSDMYKGQPRMDEIFKFMFDHGFDLVSFYDFYFWENKASWSEALFVHPAFSSNALA